MINHIVHILQLSAPQPRLPLFTLLSILPAVPILTPLSPPINRPDTPDQRLVPVMQPSRVQSYQPAPTAPLRVQHTTSHAIDPSTNPCIEVVYNHKKTNPTIPTEPKPALPYQVQHRLRCTLLNARTNFREQVTHHIMEQHMFNLPHAFHIYNNKGKKETIDNLVVGKHSDTWWKAVLNELIRISNIIGKLVRETNNINFI